jgi:KDO2-lipid IV(A) lauroyltransferase
MLKTPHAPPRCSGRQRPQHLLHPRYWVVWLSVGLLRLGVLLSYRLQLAIGRAIGRSLLRSLKRRRFIADLNLRACLPELDPAARARLLRAHFESLGIALFEIAWCWWGDAKRLRAMVEVEGLEHLEAARAAGRGAIMLSSHFTTLEIGGRLLGLFTPMRPMYKPSHNPVVQHLMCSHRSKHFDVVIPADDVRLMLRSLKDNVPIWYAPDQGFRGKGAVFAPFFGHPAPTNPATSRIARASGAPVLPFMVFRKPDGAGYRLRILPPLEAFPGESLEADCARINALVEAQVREAPEQYLWVHNRFKTSAHVKPPKAHDPMVRMGLLEAERDYVP